MLAAAPLAGALLIPAPSVAQEQPAAPPTGAEPIDAPNPIAAEPASPTEFVLAAARLRRIGRPGLSRQYLRALLDSAPTDEALLEARDELGPAVFFELSTDLLLRPEGQTLQVKVREAVAARGADPVRLDGLIDALTAAPREREAATAALIGLGAAGTPRLVERLITSADAVEGNARSGEAIARLLGRLGEASVPPLTAGLRSRQTPAGGRAVIAAALGGTGSQNAVDALLAPAFSPDESPAVQSAARLSLSRLTNNRPLRGLFDVAADRLRQKAERLLSDPPAPVEGSAAIPLYRYDAAENRLVATALPPATANRYQAAAAASDAARVAPGRADLRVLELTAALAYESSLVGRGQFVPRGEGTVHRAALTAGSDRVLKALDRALDLNAPDAAAATLQVLLDVPTPDLLRSVGGGGSPVVRALRSPAPEVRFLAALLSARANPGEEFGDGPAVIEVFAGALTDSPGGRAVVIDPSAERGSQMAGLLQGLGYRVELAVDTRDGFERAVSGAGADLVAVHANVQGLPVSSVAANLRADARTRSVPLALYGHDRLDLPLSRIASRAGDATFVPFPIPPETLERKLAPLRSVAEPLPDALKVEQKQAAAAALAALAQAGPGPFPFHGALAELSSAAADATISADVSAVLAVIPDPIAQNTLVEVLTVIRPGADAEAAAGEALAQSVRRFGSLLTPTAVDAVRRRAAGEQDPRLRDVMLILSRSLPGASEPLPVEVALPSN